MKEPLEENALEEICNYRGCFFDSFEYIGHKAAYNNPSPYFRKINSENKTQLRLLPIDTSNPNKHKIIIALHYRISIKKPILEFPTIKIDKNSSWIFSANKIFKFRKYDYDITNPVEVCTHAKLCDSTFSALKIRGKSQMQRLLTEYYEKNYVLGFKGLLLIPLESLSAVLEKLKKEKGIEIDSFLLSYSCGIDVCKKYFVAENKKEDKKEEIKIFSRIDRGLKFVRRKMSLCLFAALFLLVYFFFGD